MIKRGLCLLGLLVMYFLLLPSGSVEASETTGTWGNVTWIFESDTGVISFTSGGTLGTNSSSPWNSSNGISATSIVEIKFSQETFAPANASYLFGTGNITTGLFSLINFEGLSYLNTSKVTNMAYMFNNIAVTSLDISTFNTSAVTSMVGMFANDKDLQTIDVSNFDTSKVDSFYGMFYENTSLTSLDLSSFNTASGSNFAFMFAHDSSLQTLTLGTHSLIGGSANLPSINTSEEYTGKWVGVSGNATGNLYDSSTDFMTNYSSSYSGTYVWQTLQTLEVKDSTIKTTDSWTAADNFNSATNTFGTPVDFGTSDITTSGTVDTKTAGTYEVTYMYGPLTKIATVIVEDVSASLTVEFIQGSTMLSDYTLNLTDYKVWDTVDLTSVESVTNQIANLESLGYTVTSPASTDVTLDSAENSVQYTVTGALGLLFPESISFPSTTYTGETQTLSSSSTGDLTVQDTLSTTDETGWSLQVAVTKALASGARLSYLNSNNQSTLLSSTNQTIASSESGSKAISEDWGTATTDAGIKLTLDGSVGVGNYSGTLTWTLQAGPEA